jgi:sterol desaturase/sphingolipid hydroxylase (fatty acid hydroxylase superfamily)
VTDILATVERTQLIAAFVGLAVMLSWETAHPFFALFRQRKTRGWHLVRNLLLGGLNAALIVIVFVGLWLWAAAWAEARGFGIMHWLGASLGLPLWVHAVGAVLLLDGWTYLWHRLNHRVPFLWRFHRVHHADARMDVTTASRFHIGEIFLSSLLRIPLIILFGIYVWELLLYETVMFAVVQFHHANVALPGRLDRVLRLVIVTPGMHKVHHSRWRPETDSNYSAFLSIWDRLFRSFRTRERLEEIHLGLNEFDGEEHTTLKALMTMPLAEVSSKEEVSHKEEVSRKEKAVQKEDATENG